LALPLKTQNVIGELRTERVVVHLVPLLAFKLIACYFTLI
jgi:hypothetical protein